MKNGRKILFVFAAAVMLTGCLQIQTTLYVMKDGSGTINEKIFMSKTFADMLREFTQSFQDSAAAEEFSLFNNNEIMNDAKGYGENVEYVSHEYVSDENWEGYTVIYSFKDVNEIRLIPDPDEKVDVGIDVKQPDEDQNYYYFSFIPGEISELNINRPDLEAEISEESEDTLEAPESEAGTEFVKMMEGMKIKVSIVVDGTIQSTNASYVEGSEITLLQMDFDEMMKDEEGFKKFIKKQPNNIEQMKEFLAEFPGMKIEIQKPVTVKFK